MRMWLPQRADFYHSAVYGLVPSVAGLNTVGASGIDFLASAPVPEPAGRALLLLGLGLGLGLAGLLAARGLKPRALPAC